ncbi:hypothetical protein C4A77_00550 [Brevibacillus laterosporus]|uniref:Uncharacterized protein n=1 Tax=Brevibacillus laterosporus TaxID=1465 RepID=A0AAP8QH96_BRELA|nr:hypothetical protein C4A77_00550 [Brevibacillus laterosporus]
MDTSPYYKLMCQRAKELQEVWKPKVGDFISTTSCYCNNQKNCSNDQMCLGCAKMSNTYIISGQYDFAESVGGTHWFYGGHACVRGDGNRLNSTGCYVMTESGISGIYTSKYECSSKKCKIWLPRQDQFQNMLWEGLSDTSKVRKFIDYIGNKAYTDSIESLWLNLYMKERYRKGWNSLPDMMQWE